jgi:hypothetical protein
LWFARKDEIAKMDDRALRADARVYPDAPDISGIPGSAAWFG